MSNIERILDLVPPEIGQTAFIHSDQSYSTFDFHGFIRASDERVRAWDKGIRPCGFERRFLPYNPRHDDCFNQG